MTQGDRRWKGYTLVPFELSKEDFREGRQNDCRFCPAALTICRKLEIDPYAYVPYKGRKVHVYSGGVEWFKDGIGIDKRWCGNRLREFVRKFARDNLEDEFELPFKFKLRVPDAMLP